MDKILNNIFAIILIVFLLSSALGTYLGIRDYKNEVRDRALKMGVKECYSNQDIKIIIFGEIQE